MLSIINKFVPFVAYFVPFVYYLTLNVAGATTARESGL